MKKRFIAVALSGLIVLLAAGPISVVVSDWDNWDETSSDLQYTICAAEWNLRVLRTLETVKQERTERVLSYSPLTYSYASSYFPISIGIPAKLGQDLLSFIQQRTT